MKRGSGDTLLFGAGGQLGARLETLLAARGPVRAVRHAELDLRDLERLRTLIRETRPGLIVNAAAYTAVDAAEADVESAQLVNAEAPRVMAESAAELEESPTRPLGVYGATKLAGEQAVAASGAAFLTLRTAWLYSNHGKNFLNTMLRLAAERDELRVVNDQTGCPTYSDLVAEATIAMLDGLYAAGSVRRERCGLYHVTCHGETSWWGFAQRIVELAGFAARVTVRPIPTSEYPTPARRPAYSVLANTKLERVFGIRLPDWQEGLERCLRERVG
jgi:dTDP-4-dehydrorhamnose reductase